MKGPSGGRLSVTATIRFKKKEQGRSRRDGLRQARQKPRRRYPCLSWGLLYVVVVVVVVVMNEGRAQWWRRWIVVATHESGKARVAAKRKQWIDAVIGGVGVRA